MKSLLILADKKLFTEGTVLISFSICDLKILSCL
jgi:hypothetical protein